ncbi:MAG: SIMPL domain-containing protein [Armatimonadetes bacterium]|nr:SIMPL domain-containing protein [Armatimonadota bacterium]
MNCACRLLVVCCAVGVFLTAQSVQSGEVPNQITVSATATAKSKPDIAFVVLGVSTDNKDAGKAAQENAKTTASVVDALLRIGVQRSDIETVQYSVSPVMNYQTNPPTTSGYRVSNIVRVRVKDLTKLGSLIDTAVDAGSNQVQSVRFDLEDGTKLRHQALVDALKKADADARLMAKTLGVEIGMAISASQTAPVVPSPLELGVVREAAASPIIPGEIEATAGVTVVYPIISPVKPLPRE